MGRRGEPPRSIHDTVCTRLGDIIALPSANRVLVTAAEAAAAAAQAAAAAATAAADAAAAGATDARSLHGTPRGAARGRVGYRVR